MSGSTGDATPGAGSPPPLPPALADPGPGAPTAPIALAPLPPDAAHLPARRVEVPDDVVDALRDVCAEVRAAPGELVDASRDWWPLAMTWAAEGRVGQVASVLVRPGAPEEVAAVLARCNRARVPVTVAAGRSGVCGGSVPVHGGVLLDLTGLRGIRDVDATSGVVDVAAGTFGDHLERELRVDHGLTLGHWPQSLALSTVGGWLACRGAGQFSTRYGKIEDMVVGLDAVLASGRSVTTGGHAPAAAGPDLTQVFVGSEGTLGVVTGARLRAWPVPTYERSAAWSFPSFAAGLEACRRVLRRGATPAVLRLYDDVEAKRSFDLGDRHVLLVHDEGDRAVVDGMWSVVEEECAEARSEDPALVAQWLGHRNDVSFLEQLIAEGYLVDTIEVTGRWRDLPRIYERAIAALRGLPDIAAASAHQSHSYPDGACLYFSFGGRPAPDQREARYVEAWDAVTRAVLAEGGSLSHHHGVGLNRSRFVAEALGEGFSVLAALKQQLDPNGILNPGKLGLASPFGAVGWP
ncbi:MAG: FAD-binding oxidoreductase [Actinomycetota bacterium]|nr:FAD-binding oxidoreductase [Actinomycetota bacterium]